MIWFISRLCRREGLPVGYIGGRFASRLYKRSGLTVRLYMMGCFTVGYKVLGLIRREVFGGYFLKVFI